ncbi:hypothetical protein quinque_003105 [Culex quinquefasciatus]
MTSRFFVRDDGQGDVRKERMSGLMRLNGGQGSLLVRALFQQAAGRNARLISSSQKNRDAATIDVSKKAAAKPAEPAAKAAASSKNWVSYGFDTKNEADDKNAMHASFFFSVTLCLVFGTFYWAYLPDTQLQDWSQREAYLELRRREAAGLEPISKDYIDPALMVLPSDEELGDTEIVI